MMDRIKVALRADSNVGLTLRTASFLIAMGMLLGICRILSLKWAPDLDFRELLVVFLVTMVPIAVSIVLSELPRGHDWVLIRLSLATFCRTGLPIFLLVAITLISKKQFQPVAVGCLTLFYIIGLLLVVLISVSRFAPDAGESAANDEVDRVSVAGRTRKKSK